MNSNMPTKSKHIGCGVVYILLAHLCGIILASAATRGETNIWLPVGILFIAGLSWLITGINHKKAEEKWGFRPLILTLFGILALGQMATLGFNEFTYQKGCINRLSPGSDLSRCDFSQKDISNSDLHDSILVAANFSKAIVKEVNFQNANLEKANFSGADITGADLNGADLKDVIFIDTVGLTDASLATFLGIAISDLPFEVTRNQIRLEDQSHISKKMAGVCSGEIVPDSIPFSKTASFHSIMAVDEAGHPMLEEGFSMETMAVRFSELVVCVEKNEQYEAGGCSYTGSRYATKIGNKRDVSIIEAATGKSILKDTVYGPNPDCPKVLGSSRIRGGSVGPETITKYLERLDLSKNLSIDLTNPAIFPEDQNMDYTVIKKIHYKSGLSELDSVPGGNFSIEFKYEYQNGIEKASRVSIISPYGSQENDELVFINDKAYRVNKSVGCQEIAIQELKPSDYPDFAYPEVNIALTGIAKLIPSNIPGDLMNNNDPENIPVDEYRINTDNIVNPEQYKNPLEGSIIVDMEGNVVRVELNAPVLWPMSKTTVDVRYVYLYGPEEINGIVTPPLCQYILKDNRVPVMAGAANFVITAQNPEELSFRFDVSASHEDVAGFYTEALTRKGWVLNDSILNNMAGVSRLSFIKDNEELGISINGDSLAIVSVYQLNY